MFRVSRSKSIHTELNAGLKLERQNPFFLVICIGTRSFWSGGRGAKWVVCPKMQYWFPIVHLEPVLWQQQLYQVSPQLRLCVASAALMLTRPRRQTHVALSFSYLSNSFSTLSQCNRYGDVMHHTSIFSHITYLILFKTCTKDFLFSPMVILHPHFTYLSIRGTGIFKFSSALHGW